MLEKHLLEQFKITKETVLTSPMTGKTFLLSDLLETIKNRKTEGNVKETLELAGVTNRKGAIMYLTGIADRFEMEGIS